MNAIDYLVSKNACDSGVAEVREAGTLRAAWDLSTSRANMMWLLGKLHIDGRLSRKHLVRVAVRCAEVVAHIGDPERLPHLATIGSWAAGEDDVSADEVAEARKELWRIRSAAFEKWGQTRAAAHDADADAAAADAAAHAAAADAAAHAADAHAADAAHVAGAAADVIAKARGGR